MKKSFRLVSLLLVAVLLLPSLVACKGNERPISEQISAIADDKGKALFLLDTADENLKKLQSYTGTETMTIGIPVNGQSLDLSTTTVLEIERQNKADFIGKLHETATVKSGDVTSLQEVVTGYQESCYARHQDNMSVARTCTY